MNNCYFSMRTPDVLYVHVFVACVSNAFVIGVRSTHTFTFEPDRSA